MPDGIAAGDSDGALSSIADRVSFGVLDLPKAESQSNPLNNGPVWVVERLSTMAPTFSFALPLTLPSCLVGSTSFTLADCDHH
jgi:hypothetical protein